MQNNDPYFEIGLLKKKIDAIKIVIDEVKTVVKPEEELWDNSDMIRNWKLSARTLADWRSKGLIGFVQVGSKIWYPRESRELFLQVNYHKSKVEGREDEGEN